MNGRCASWLCTGACGAYLPAGFGDNIDDAVRQVNEQLKASGLVAAGDTVVYTAALPFTAHRDTNMLRIEQL